MPELTSIVRISIETLSPTKAVRITVENIHSGTATVGPKLTFETSPLDDKKAKETVADVQKAITAVPGITSVLASGHGPSVFQTAELTGQQAHDLLLALVEALKGAVRDFHPMTGEPLAP